MTAHPLEVSMDHLPRQGLGQGGRRVLASVDLLALSLVRLARALRPRAPFHRASGGPDLDAAQ
eukprot:433301-Pyramimonas_sp.AAC.1